MTLHMIKKTTSKLVLSAATCLAAFWLNPVMAADENITSNKEGTHDGYFYSFWKDSGNVTFGLRSGGRYTSQWSNINNWVGGKGWNPGSSDKVINYTGSYPLSNSQNSYLALYGWTRSPLIEYYVIESFGSYNPSTCSGGTDYGSFQSDGATYNVRRCQRVNQPSIDGTKTFYQYFSVRNPKQPFGQVSGTITFANHAKYWKSKGLDLGSHYYMIMATEGYQSSGSSDITLTSGPAVQSCGDVAGVPICCKIAADPDGDGIGMENGKACTVTEKTEGYKPPSSSSSSSSVRPSSSSSSIRSSVASSVWSSASVAPSSSSVASSAPSTSTGGSLSGVFTLLIGGLLLMFRRTRRV